MNKEKTIDWLLQGDNPPVRLLTLTHLLNLPEIDPKVQATREKLMDYSVAKCILKHFDEISQLGYRTFWSYKAKNWNIIYLGHFLTDGRDPRIAAFMEERLDYQWSLDKFACYSACILTAFRRLGYADHPAVIERTEALAQRFIGNEGIVCPGMNNNLLARCYVTLPKLLICFGEVPPAKRTPYMWEAIARITQGLLENHVYIYRPGNRKARDAVRPRSRKHADYPEGETPETFRDKAKARFLAEHGFGELEPNKNWTRFGFPLNYNSDIMEAMFALALVDTPMSPALEKPLQVILNKRGPDGRWCLEKSLNGQM
jgi:hypothetical protein